MNHYIWQPIAESELNELIENELKECSPELVKVFQTYRIDPVRLPISRNGDDTDFVFVAAKRDNEVMYYEDIEDGWNFSPLSEEGRILEHWCNQDELKYALLHWAEKAS